MQPVDFVDKKENLTIPELIEKAVTAKEGILSKAGVLTVKTGKRTGRSPKDKFIVKDDFTKNTVNWGSIHQPIEKHIFNKLWEKAYQHVLQKNILFIYQIYKLGRIKKLILKLK